MSGSGDIVKNITVKINNYKRVDKARFHRHGNVTQQDVCNLIVKQNFQCYVCKDDLELYTWDKNCCYQFSIDRIDENKPHDCDNVLVSCYYCNCRFTRFINTPHKVCQSGCHTDVRDIVRTREDVQASEIDAIRAKMERGMICQENDEDGALILRKFEDFRPTTTKWEGYGNYYDDGWSEYVNGSDSDGERGFR